LHEFEILQSEETCISGFSKIEYTHVKAEVEKYVSPFAILVTRQTASIRMHADGN
jgi:hypothetical protein